MAIFIDNVRGRVRFVVPAGFGGKRSEAWHFGAFNQLDDYPAW